MGRKTCRGSSGGGRAADDPRIPDTAGMWSRPPAWYRYGRAMTRAGEVAVRGWRYRGDLKRPDSAGESGREQDLREAAIACHGRPHPARLWNQRSIGWALESFGEDATVTESRRRVRDPGHLIGGNGVAVLLPGGSSAVSWPRTDFRSPTVTPSRIPVSCGTGTKIAIGCALTSLSETGRLWQSSRTSATRAERHDRPIGRASNPSGVTSAGSWCGVADLRTLWRPCPQERAGSGGTAPPPPT